MQFKLKIRPKKDGAPTPTNTTVNTISSPYANARQVWNEYYADELMAKRNWQIIALVLATAVVLLIGGFISQASQSKIVPWIVQVDSLGRAVATGPATATSTVDARIIKAQLFRFIEQARSVITDWSVLKRNMQDVYGMTAPALQTNFLNPYYIANNPVELATKISRVVEITSFLTQSDNTYLIEWKEIDRDRKTAQVLREARWKALVTVTILPPKSENAIAANPVNPFGIYVTQLSWTEQVI